MINRIIGKLAESDNALVDRKRVNIREALNKIDCEHYTDFLNLYECANLPLDKKKALAQELVKEEVDLKVIESFFDKALLETGEWADDVEESLEENNSFTESVLPRNAKTITATSRYDGTSTKLTKKDGVWSDGKQGYGNSFLRNNYDIKVDEIDKDYKPKRTKEVVVLQGNYGYGWDDLITYEKGDPDIRADLKSYRENEPGVAHRVIYRRIPVDTQE